MAEIHSHGIESINEAALSLQKAFVDNPIHRWQVGAQDLLSPKDAKKSEVVWRFQVKLFMLSGARIDEVDGFSAVAVWLPAGRKLNDGVVNVIRSGAFPVIAQTGLTYALRTGLQYESSVKTARKKHLSDQHYYVLAMLGTLPQAQGKGLGSKLIRKYFEIADKEGVPIWLEAAAPHARDLYLHLGFVIVETVRFGIGKIGEDGRKEKTGLGVPCWYMIRYPQAVGQS